MFYSWNSEYSREPVDLDDFCDGLRVMRAKAKEKEIYNAKE